MQGTHAVCRAKAKSLTDVDPGAGSPLSDHGGCREAAADPKLHHGPEAVSQRAWRLGNFEPFRTFSCQSQETPRVGARLEGVL